MNFKFNSTRRPLNILGGLLEKMSLERQRKRWLTGIMMVAMACLIPTFTAYSDKHTFAGDSGTWAIATNLVNGQGYSGCSTDYFPFCDQTNQATAMREPVPVLLMALAMLIFHSKIAGLVIQSLLYLGTIPVIYAILKKDNTLTALLAAFLWALSIPVMGQVGKDTGELTAAFFLSLGLLFFLKGRKGSGKRDWIFSGIFMGMAALSRTVFLGVSLGLGSILLLMEFLKVFRGSRKQLTPILLFLGTVGLVVTPWIVRNSIEFGTPVIGSSLAGYNVFRMNYIVASKPFSPHYVGSEEGYQAVAQLLQKSNLTGTENEAQMQSIYMKAGLQIIAQHPRHYIELALYRFRDLWFNTSVYAAYNTKPDLTDLLKTIQQALLLIAVLIGASGNPKKNWPFILSLILGCGAYMAVDAQLRYLVDLMPLVVILAAQAIPNLKLRTSDDSRRQVQVTASARLARRCDRPGRPPPAAGPSRGAAALSQRPPSRELSTRP